MSSARRSVLVVEDSDEDFATVDEAAKRASFPNPLHRANTGEECLALLRGEAGDGFLPAMVLLDLNTPGIDGREALEAIRSDVSFGALPVVVLSTSSNPRDIAECYALGANAYHVKPVQYPEHLKLVTELLTYWLTTSVLPELEEIHERQS